jgi:hypothetical protein
MAKQNTRVKLYPDLKVGGFFEPPEEIAELIDKIETAIIEDVLDDTEVARYEVIERLLASPTGMFLVTIKEMLEEILECVTMFEEEPEEAVDVAADAQLKLLTHQSKKEDDDMIYHTNNYAYKSTKEVDDPEVPISIADLDEWYRKTPGVITGFYGAKHAEKYRMYLTKLEEIALESRDLSDDELWADLEGPEQSD